MPIKLEYLLKGLFPKALFLVPWLWASGHWSWPWAWLYIAVFILFDVLTVLIVDPELLRERLSRHSDSKRWDAFYVSFAAFFLPLLSGIVAGLELRSGWSNGISNTIQWAAVCFVSLGFALVAWSMHANSYFSAIVRIQTDRGHQVATGGPYQYVRHPGYVGAMLFTTALPLMLGSIWGLLPALMADVLYIMRTKREDDTLRAELAGYEEFTQKTQYRLLPGIW